ncbi:MAG: ABC transporter ATP-binding protein [bacterium]|nr:ABC transporter ATP-binding protein [bacterium]
MIPDQAHDVVQLRDVSFTWPGQHRFNITIDEFVLQGNEHLLLLGPSGSGKSTLLSLLAGIVQPRAGDIRILGTDMTALGSAARDRFRAEHFGIIFQMFNLLPYGAVVDNVLLPLRFAPGRRARAIEAGGVEKEAHRLLTALGIEEELHTQPAAQLSVGQQQRVAASRALIGAPEIIIADEPTSALDRDRQRDFLDLLFSQAHKVGAALIMVSHDSSHKERFGRTENLRDMVCISKEDVS